MVPEAAVGVEEPALLKALTEPEATRCFVRTPHRTTVTVTKVVSCLSPGEEGLTVVSIVSAAWFSMVQLTLNPSPLSALSAR